MKAAKTPREDGENIEDIDAQPMDDPLTCGACKRTSIERKCKYFNISHQMFLCEECGCSLLDNDEDNEACIVSIGNYAKTLTETKKKSIEEQLLQCEKIKNEKTDYVEYLSNCEPGNNVGKTAFQTEIYKVKYDMKRLGKLHCKLQVQFDELKSIYNKHNAVTMIQKRDTWKNYESKLTEIEGSHKPRLHLSDDGTVSSIYPNVILDKFCYFRTVTGQDIDSRQVKKARILHAGDLCVFSGGYPFWEDYYKSEIRPFVTLADDNKDEMLMYLMQISPYGRKWSKNDEMSGTPYFDSVKTDRFGNKFVLGEEENAVYVHQGSNVTRVKLPVNGPDEYYSPVILCIDPERDLLCVYTKDTNYFNEEVYVYKIRYTFDSHASEDEITDSDSESAENEAEQTEPSNSNNCRVKDSPNKTENTLYNCAVL